MQACNTADRDPPPVTVVVRSFNRPAALNGLLAALLRQDYPAFEIVVVEQSTDMPRAETEALERHAADPRLRVLRFPPLGGARARNAGVAAARGDIVVFIDDDDLPIGDRWIDAHVANYGDPNCLGVTGRHVRQPGEAAPYGRFTGLAYRRCQSFSRLLRLPFTYARIDSRKAPIDYLHGTNGSVRRTAVGRFGGWDEDTRIEDEASFGFRAQRGMRPEEYFVFDPEPVVLRGTDVRGGLDKRFMSVGEHYERFLDFIVTIVGRYHRPRVTALFPLYVLAAFAFTLSWLWDDSHAHQDTASRVAAAVGLLLTLPYRAVRCTLRRARSMRA